MNALNDNNIKFIKGDATQPEGNGNKIIIHCCNDIGAWGAGFVIALSNKWPEPEQYYRQWFKDKESQAVEFKLGRAIICQVVDSIYVMNIIGQKGIANKNNQSPIVYDAIRNGVKQVKFYANLLNASVHMPRMGCGLAGGKWEEIEKIINEELCGIQVTVYDF